jgi:hypothetical protein
MWLEEFKFSTITDEILREIDGLGMPLNEQ